AVYHLMTSHRQSAALANEIPDFASVLSYKMAAQRRPGDSLPTVMKVGELTPGPGFFGVEHAGLFLSEEGRVRNLRHEFENGDRRMALMDNLLKDLKTGSDTRADHMRNLGQARKMMTDQTLIQLLGIPETGENEEGGEEEMEENNFLAQCQTAARVIAADKGTRVFQMTLFGWDHHDNIYDQNNPGALPGLARALDDGVAYLIDDLGSKPASSGTGTLLDETLIVAVGEFGRTVNGLNTSAGRDHFPYVLPALFAGGGVKGGRAVGSSSADGSYIQDRGWSHSHYMGINDLAATIYSALGIDWTERFADTPSGRVFEMVDMTVSNQVAAIDPLFV
nr:DUF1501 domain-containing protein [Acidobacteriota bacterium]